MILHYMVQVTEQGALKYLFRSGILVNEERLAKPFSNLILAKRYFQKSKFVGMRYTILPVYEKVTPPLRHNLGSIVE